ncbi:Protein CBR-SET-10 [Caenorhabditis briggsae]|uniref:Protein CBR-SET-10 n=1 Tax=Caenorhabditis briggsae TaxID=6238 RepID=A8XWG2_CAEBR|nr:Protein CBR-SET-10 [Caenorhabditis briggsae]CAP36981.2 Protein CBR-SET-10 [Caenorhabditis briggsae]
MYTVAREKPLAAVLSPEFQDTYCATCFSEIDPSHLDSEILTCDDCTQVSYCSLKCQRKDWKTVHQLECEILRGTAQNMTVTMRLCVRVLLNTIGNSNGPDIDALETNYKEFRSSPKHNQFLSDILTIIKASGHNIFPESMDNNKMIAIICSVLCNSFGIIAEKRVEPIGSGMYVGLATHNHSCASTCHVVFDGNQAVLRSRDRQYCKNTTISYVSRMLPTFERQKSIRNVHFITCRCEMCLNEDLDLTGLASKCQTSKCQGFVKGANGSCTTCGKPAMIPFEQSTQSTSKLLDTLENLHKSQQLDTVQEYRHLQNLQEEYGRILADCNVAILQLDEQLAYCASEMKNVPEDMELIAIRGVQHFISRLGIGAPEVTRRLYIACKCLSRLQKYSMDIPKLAVQSSLESHGEDHPISKFLADLVDEPE